MASGEDVAVSDSVENHLSIGFACFNAYFFKDQALFDTLHVNVESAHISIWETR